MAACSCRRALWCMVASWAFVAALCAHPDPAKLEREGLRGYQYEGQTQFVASRGKQGLPTLKLEQVLGQQRPAGAEYRTVLVHRDGSRFTKRLPVSEDEPEVQEAMSTVFPGMKPSEAQAAAAGAAEQSSRRRSLKQSSNIQVTSTDSDLSCVGCPTTDTRVEITATTTYPYSAVGMLLGALTAENEDLQCSGILIGRSHVLTAAHCVFDINNSLKLVDSIDFFPGLAGTGTNAEPYGSILWSTVRLLDVFENQTSYTATAMNNDFALITLASEAPVACGYFSLYQPPSTGSGTFSITTAGYPGSKPSGTMWESTCSGVQYTYAGGGQATNVLSCSDGSCSNVILHTCLSSDGQSGSGMWDVNTTSHSVLTGKVEDTNGDGYNVGTGLDVFVYNTIAGWYNEDSNDTLPTTPTPGTGTASTSSQSNGISIRTPWVIAIIAVVGGLALLAILGALITCCCHRNRFPAKASPSAYPAGAYAAQAYPQGYDQQAYSQQGYGGQQQGYPQQGYPQSFTQQQGGYAYPQAQGRDGTMPEANGGYPAGIEYDDRFGHAYGQHQ